MACLPNRSRRLIDDLEARFVRASLKGGGRVGYGGQRYQEPRNMTIKEVDDAG